MITIMVDSAAGISRQEAEQLGAHYVPITRPLRTHYAAIQPGSRRPTQSAACS